jgi:hypothetical protein
MAVEDEAFEDGVDVYDDDPPEYEEVDGTRESIRIGEWEFPADTEPEFLNQARLLAAGVPLTDILIPNKTSTPSHTKLPASPSSNSRATASRPRIPLDGTPRDIEYVETSAWVEVQLDATPTTSTGKGKGRAKKAPTPALRGPFDVSTKSTMDSISASIAGALGCDATHLKPNQFMYRYESPKNALPKPFSTPAGFTALLQAIEFIHPKTNKSIIFSVPEPVNDTTTANKRIRELEDQLSSQGQPKKVFSLFSHLTSLTNASLRLVEMRNWTTSQERSSYVIPQEIASNTRISLVFEQEQAAVPSGSSILTSPTVCQGLHGRPS